MQVFRMGAMLALALVTDNAQAQTHPDPEAHAIELLKRGIAFRSVAGPGNQTFDYATYLRGELIAGGFAPEDVRVERVDDTAYLVARFHGTGKARNGAKPLLIAGHLDVVAAKTEDWERDPFTPIIENGYIFGRGSYDMKADISTMTATLIQLKREGFKPARDIVFLASGDEETEMKTSQILAEEFDEAELLLNIDGGGGDRDEQGKPIIFGLEGAEKTYADFELVFTDAGGHSSTPKRQNAIYSLARALGRIAAYEFPGQVNEITRAKLEALESSQSPDVARAIRRFLADPGDKEALKILRDRPDLIGQTGTTCVATMVQGGHAPNALPQRATASVNCRIFPGTSIASVQAKLIETIDDPALQIRHVPSGSVANDASPLRPDLIKVITKAIHARFPGLRVVPDMSTGASDSMWFRAKGVHSYGVNPIFMKASDQFAHGLNERVPLSEIAPSITYYRTLLTELTK